MYYCIAEPLDVLESWVVELFSDVKKGVQVKPEFTVKDPIWQAGRLYKLEAVEDVHILDLAWTLPCLQHNYLKKPEDYIAHILGHGEIAFTSLMLSQKFAIFLCNKKIATFPLFAVRKKVF